MSTGALMMLIFGSIILYGGLGVCLKIAMKKK
ncbi:MetS family NSS transporter small subunit [Selenihalanaerobacter shriftii]|nr:MetS family NSS transporter small subunit [Selenihalanaerobacter shriftii]